MFANAKKYIYHKSSACSGFRLFLMSVHLSFKHICNIIKSWFCRGRKRHTFSHHRSPCGFGFSSHWHEADHTRQRLMDQSEKFQSHKVAHSSAVTRSASCFFFFYYCKNKTWLCSWTFYPLKSLSPPNSVSDKHTNTSRTDAHPAIHNHNVLCWYGCNVVYSGSGTERFYAPLSTVVNIEGPTHVQAWHKRPVGQPPALNNDNTLHTTNAAEMKLPSNCWKEGVVKCC